MILKYQNVTINVPNKNKTFSEKYLKLVDGLNGEFQSGELTAIMGPSGCGKTTFLSALAGRIQEGSKTLGEITIDGEERSIRKWMEVTGFVDQDDQIFEKLTVEQTLTYAANFRLSSKRRINLDRRIDELLEQFALKHVKKNEMYKLSGGERKRTMMALEMITDPEILFIDEPTSGLDTKTALKIMNILKELANQGKMIICSIHQPSIEIYSLFDKLLLMTEAKTVYNGPANTFEKFLEEKGITKREGISFPDFISEMVVRESVYEAQNPSHQIVNELIKENLEKNKTQTGNYIRKNMSYYDYRFSFWDFWYLLSRKFKLERKNVWKNTKTLLIKIAVLVIILTLIIFKTKKIKEEAFSEKVEEKIEGKVLNEAKSIWNNIVNKQVQCLLPSDLSRFLILIALFTSISAFFDEQNVIKREILTGSYSTTTYFLSLTAYYMIIDLILPIITIIIIAVYEYSWLSPLLVITCFSCSLLTIPIGMALGSITGHKKFTMIISNIMMLPSYYRAPEISGMHIKSLALPLKNYKWIRFLYYIPYAIPTTHMSAVFNHFAFRNHFDYLKKEIETYPFLIKSYFVGMESYEGSHNYIYNYCPSITAIIIMFLSLASFYTMFGIFRQAGILMPGVRMKLEKNK